MTNIVKYKGVKTTAIDLSDATVTNFVALTDGSGVTVAANGMTASPETAQEAGYITIDIDGTSYQIPIYAA